MLMRSPTRWARPKLVRPPGFILPCQPVLATKVPIGDGWLHELKHDGFRIIAHKDGDRVHLWSRNGRDRSGDFVAIADAVRALPASRIVLDGEAVAHCLEGLPHFNRLLSGDGQASACLYAFDRRRAHRPAPDAAQGAEESRPGAALLGAPGGSGRRRDVPPRLRHGARGHCREARASRYKSGSCVSWVKVKNPEYERRA